VRRNQLSDHKSKKFVHMALAYAILNMPHSIYVMLQNEDDSSQSFSISETNCKNGETCLWYLSGVTIVFFGKSNVKERS
jgi:TRAP-type mannitol/chloroaromatic compound transport system permease small subunit